MELFALHDDTPQDEGESLLQHTLKGEVLRIVYESAETGYVVFRLKDNHGTEQTAVGTMTGITPGQSVSLTGKWEVHREHGRQFHAESYSFTLPSTKDGLIAYLSSGIVKGIGKKYAEMIVDYFGEDTLDVLNNASARLNNVPGLGRKRVKAIRDAWRENSEVRDIQIYLQGLGINPVWFSRIYKRYGQEAPKVIQENPYRLASEIKGIGFIYADKVAAKLGIGKNDMRRLVSGVTYALGQARLLGHVCMPRPDFLKYLAETLTVEENEAESALNEAINTRMAAVAVSMDGSPMIYEPGMLRCENELPRLMRRLMVQPRHAGQRLSNVAPLRNTKFSAEQITAVEKVASSPISIITGGPGVGKTTVVSEIVRRAKILNIKTILAAPTGRAAKRMSEATHYRAMTLHRLLKWDPSCNGFAFGTESPLPYDLFVVDESSMLDILLAVAFFRAIKPGSTVVIVGDPDQLPSVGPGNVLNDIIDSEICPVSRLTQIFRQGNGSGIIYAAHAVNNGVMPRVPNPRPGEIADFYWVEKDDPDEAASVIERMIVERIPKRFNLDPIRDIQLLCPMNRGNVGTQLMNERLQAILNPEKKFLFQVAGHTFKSGDKVMQTTNNYDKGVFNGDMGFITKINYAEKKFTVNYDGDMDIEYLFEEAEQIVPAYAITVHKSQGSEFPAVVMPLLPQHYMMLQRNLLYTGMTRAKKLMVLVGSSRAVSMAVRNTVREPRYSLLKEKLIYGNNELA